MLTILQKPSAASRKTVTTILRRLIFPIAVLLCSMPALVPARAQTARRVPVIWCSDLFHPHQDPDDHLDLATVYALPELDVRAVLLDQGAKQEEHPGRVPLEQMMALTGKRAPYAIGLAKRLSSLEDKALDQPRQYQAAIELLFQTLRQSREPVHVIAAGSVRDLAAAFNRDPALLREKVARVHINIGRAALAGGEWNVHLDPLAYRRILESGLPIAWYPCLPLDSLVSSHWKLAHYGDVFETAPLALQNFFIYALNRVDPSEIEPLAALQTNLRPWRRLIWPREKNMWCTPSLIHAAGRNIYLRGGEWMALASPPEGATEEATFTLAPARVEVDDKGFTTRLEYDSPQPNVEAIRLSDRKRFTESMTGCLKHLFQNFPVQAAR